MLPCFRFAAFSVPAALALAGCLSAAHGPAKAQETALDLNTHARFGRIELATEHVAPKGRMEFLEHRRQWGGRVRIADTELAGLHMVDENNADVTVKVAWYDMGQQELHVTTLKQKWHDYSGDWKLVAESRTDGDPGLIEASLPAAPQGPPVKAKSAQFPSVRLTGAAPANEPPPQDDGAATAQP